VIYRAILWLVGGAITILKNMKINGKDYPMYYACIMAYLVGGMPPPLKNMKVSWDDDIPNIWKNNTCSKPPTSYGKM
jgi:hypothetical protein